MLGRRWRWQSYTEPKAASGAASGTVTYNRDSPNPKIGWHWENGMRSCHSDCDNPEDSRVRLHLQERHTDEGLLTGFPIT